MTQEELDALMADDLSDLGNSINNIDNIRLDDKEADPKDDADSVIQDDGPTSDWPPPPPTDDHKVVHQLDDVTKDSEKKATEIFDKLETINGFCADAESITNDIKTDISKNMA